MSFFQELLKRRVPQICGIYLGAIFAGVEFTDIIVERYGLSDLWVDGVLISMLTLLPTVIMVAWFHGAPGRDRWRKRELVGIPLNVIIAGALVMLLAPKQPVEAASQIRTATDENGQTVTMEVARADLVRRVAVFFLDPEGFDSEQPWESYAASMLIKAGLRADPFVEPYSLYNQYSNGLIWRLKRAGHVKGLNAPLSLLNEVAQSYHQEYFVAGSLTPLPDERWRADISLYRTETLERLTQLTLEGDSLFSISDSAIDGIISKLDRPKDTNMVVSRLPASELLTSNTEALRLYVEGSNALLLNNDYETAQAKWKQAIELDNGFAEAYADLADAQGSQGDYRSALANLKELNRLSHKLQERRRILIKAWTYQLQEQEEKATRVYEMYTELEPEKAQAWTSLGYNYMWTGNRVEDARRAFEKSLELMPNQYWLIYQLADIYRVQGDTDAAIAKYNEYHELLPTTYLPMVAIGDIKTESGDLAAAQEFYEKGQLAQTNMVTPVIKLAMNQARQGRLEEAFELFEEAEFVAEAPRQLATLYAAQSRLYSALGQPKAALDMLKRQLKMEAETLNRVDAMVNHMRNLQLYVFAGESAEAEEFLGTMDDMFGPPFDFIPRIGYMILRMAEGNVEEAAGHNRFIAKVLEKSGRKDLEYVTEFTFGMIKRRGGEIDEALRLLENAADLYRQSIQQNNDEAEAEFVQISIELARTAIMADKAERALAALQPLLTSWPYHPEGNWLAAQAQKQLGRSQAAEKSLAIARDMWADAEEGFELAEAAREGLTSASL
ncbi:MAG: hypothetical protein AAF358_19130 [Pseudomonadota bacterium]